MDSTRRDALIGGAAVATMAAAAGAARAQARPFPKVIFSMASVTPCDRNGKFDPVMYRDTLQYFESQGAEGVVVLGTTGEFPSFSRAERRIIMEAAGKNKGKLEILNNPGTPNLPETVELAKHAVDNGADGFLIIPPFYYNNPPTAGLIKYYSGIFDEVKKPIHLYHIPGTSEAPISHELLTTLKARYPNVAGIKDSTGNAEGYAAFCKAFPDLNMRTGTSSNLETALEHGMGGILADGNLFTRKCADIYAAYRAGQDWKVPLKKLRDAQAVMRAGGTGGYGPMKYALSQIMGVPQFYQRAPNVDVTEEQKTTIRNAIAQVKAMG
jgi:4-hydroxy-tetrahydrodipicolinate synthase